MAPAVVAEADGFDSYITGLRAHATPAALLRLHPGAMLRLRPGKGGGAHRLEVCTLQGEPLGWLPVEDGLALDGPVPPCAAQVTALIPARLLPRVHIRIFTPAESSWREHAAPVI